MSDSCRPLSHHTVLCKLHFSPFIINCILLEMWMVYLVSLILLAINIANLLSNIMRCSYFGTTYGCLFSITIFIILKCAITIYAVYAAFSSLSALYWATVPVTFVKWSIVPPWLKTIYYRVLMQVYGQSCQIESDNTRN